MQQHKFKNVTLVGGGVIGGGWAARFLAHGLNVTVTDPGENAEAQLKKDIQNAIPALEKQGFDMSDWQSRLTFTKDLAEAVKNAEFIQESAPEREDLKTNLLAEIDKYAPVDTVISSSSSGLLPTSIQSKCEHPERITIGHPFNPVYLLPLVEVVAGEKTSKSAVEKAKDFYQAVGKR